MLLVFLLMLSVYLVTMPQAITLEDAGLFQMICHKGGIGHPPGYPLFILSCQAFVNLPVFEQSVLAGNLMSAVFASAACSVLVIVLSQLQISGLLSISLALVYGLSAAFWSQAIIVEVYSLAVLLFLICFSLSLAYQSSEQVKYLLWLALVYGLALSNHWPLQGLGTLALLAILAPRIESIVRFSLVPTNLLAIVALIGLGLTPYLTLFQSSPDFSIYGPIETGEDFLRYVTRAAYTDQDELAGVSDKISYQLWLLELSALQFTFALGLLAGLGFILSFKLLPRHLSVALLLLYLGGTSFLNLMLGFEFNDQGVATFKPYPVISYVALVIWLGLAVRWLIDSVGQRVPWLSQTLPVLLVIMVFLGNSPRFHYSDNGFAQAYGELVLEKVPEGSVLFVEGDIGVGVIGFLHHVQNQRPDIELRSWNNLVFSNRLVSPYTPSDQQAKLRSEFIRESEKKVFSTVSNGKKGLSTGLLFQHNVERGYHCDQNLHGYIERLVALDQLDVLSNGHEKELLFGLLLEFSRLHIALLSEKKLVDGALEVELAAMAMLEQTFPGKLAVLESLFRIGGNITQRKQLEFLVESAAAQMRSRENVRIKALLEEFRGRAALVAPANLELAVSHLERSISLNSQAGNTSVCLLHQSYSQLNLDASANELLDRFDGKVCD
jgi:hypothetical protein